MPGRCAKVSSFASLLVLLLHPFITRALDGLPNLLGPLLEGIGKSLKMHVSVFIGGPEPIQQGKINAITLVYFYLMKPIMELTTIDFSLHYGNNKAAVPKVWALADVEKFSVVKNAFLEFLSTCYCKGLGQLIRVTTIDCPLQPPMNDAHELFRRVTYLKINVTLCRTTYPMHSRLKVLRLPLPLPPNRRI